MPGRNIRLTWRHDPTLDAPPRYRKACTYEAHLPQVLRDMPLVLEGEIIGLVSEAEAAIRGLNSAAAPALAPLARLLLRTESIASSKVEGMQLGIRELARAEARVDAGRTVGATATEVLANVDAMELAVEQAARAGRFRVADVRSIHARLMATGPAPRLAGRIRTVQNWIGGNDYNPCGADFVPPPPEYVEELLRDLCDAVNGELHSPIVQAALVHAQFETIHPFDDGNGRTGRALVQVVLRRRGLAPGYVPPISVVLAAARERYIAGLSGFRAGDVSGWVERFAASASRAAHLAGAYLHSVQRLTTKWEGRLAAAANPRAGAAAWAVIEVLPAHPVITAPVAVAATGRARAAIHQAIGELVDARVLLPLSESKRNRSWEAAGLLDLLERLEAER